MAEHSSLRTDALEPIDPDIGSSPIRRDAATVAAISFGGIVGAVARYEANLTWPAKTDGFPWTTLGINLLGSALLATVVVLATEVFANRRLLRPLLGTGVLGGFTTFSTFGVENQRLLAHGHVLTAVVYTSATTTGCVLAAWAFSSITKSIVRRWPA